MTGTLLNAAAVLVGTTIGTLLGNRLPERVRDIALQGVGLVTLLIGTQMALQAQNLLIVLASMVIGGVVGEVLRIEDGLDALGRRLELRFGSPEDSEAGEKRGNRLASSRRRDQQPGVLRRPAHDPRLGPGRAPR